MARHCVRWASGRKSKKSKARRGGARKGHRCRFGKVKRGPRKGQCLKVRRPRRRRNTASAAVERALNWSI